MSLLTLYNTVLTEARGRSQWHCGLPPRRGLWAAQVSVVVGDPASLNSSYVSHGRCRLQHTKVGWGLRETERPVSWALHPPGFPPKTLGPPPPLLRLHSFMTFSDLNGNFLTEGTGVPPILRATVRGSPQASREPTERPLWSFYALPIFHPRAGKDGEFYSRAC